MDGPKLTEERLRHHLDTNQVMRERMCLALLPLLGPYTCEQPRRPKGGPDGGRDIETAYQGTIPVWGAVGFRNGGGADDSARHDAEEKFKSDLDRALAENPSLAGFVFFTNVDLTPTRIESLKTHAHGKNIKIIDVFDMERLRHVLDSPEGLIARLQYLDIPMSATEQAALVAKFGNQLQNAVAARFDRVERTLAQMERFLDFQKPLLRLDVYIELAQPATSVAIGSEAIRLNIHGLHDISKTLSCLCVNHIGHQDSSTALVTQTHVWTESVPSKTLSLSPSINYSLNVMTSYSELSLSTAGQRVRIADLTILGFDAYCTSGFRDRIKQIAVDANGYEMFCCLADGQGEAASLRWVDGLPYDTAASKWVHLVKRQRRNVLFRPPKPSGRFLPLQRID
jgi:hypothetical protein